MSEKPQQLSVVTPHEQPSLNPRAICPKRVIDNLNLNMGPADGSDNALVGLARTLCYRDSLSMLLA